MKSEKTKSGTHVKRLKIYDSVQWPVFLLLTAHPVSLHITGGASSFYLIHTIDELRSSISFEILSRQFVLN